MANHHQNHLKVLDEFSTWEDVRLHKDYKKFKKQFLLIPLVILLVLILSIVLNNVLSTKKQVDETNLSNAQNLNLETKPSLNFKKNLTQNKNQKNFLNKKTNTQTKKQNSSLLERISKKITLGGTYKVYKKAEK